MGVLQRHLPGNLLGRLRLEGVTVIAQMPIRFAEFALALLSVYFSVHTANL
jgi:hypothetical protein